MVMRTMRRTGRWRGPIAVCAAVAVLPLAACQPSDTGPTPTVGSISASYAWPSQGATACTVSTGFAFSYSPVTVGGGSGTASTVVHQVSGASLSGSSCLTSDAAMSLRPGTWRITVGSGENCTVTVAAGQITVARLSRGASSC